MSHSSGGENALHHIFRDSFLRKKGLSAPGDDCARVAPPTGSRLQISTDQVVLGVHLAEDARPGAIARKLVRRSLSDLAAAGARPWACLWTVAAPANLELKWMKRLSRAFINEAGRFGMSVIGGDLSNAKQLVCSCTVIGLESRVRTPGRSGAKRGHRLLVSGRLGAAVESGRHLNPEPRLTEGRLLVESYRARAMMDLSDGLAKDLQRLCEASQCCAEVDLSCLPLARRLKKRSDAFESALFEGEDYELLVVLRASDAKRALNDPILNRTGLTDIGRIRSLGEQKPGISWLSNGQAREFSGKGWGHSWQ